MSKLQYKLGILLLLLLNAVLVYRINYAEIYKASPAHPERNQLNDLHAYDSVFFCTK